VYGPVDGLVFWVVDCDLYVVLVDGDVL